MTRSRRRRAAGAPAARARSGTPRPPGGELDPALRTQTAWSLMGTQVRRWCWPRSVSRGIPGVLDPFPDQARERSPARTRETVRLRQATDHLPAGQAHPLLHQLPGGRILRHDRAVFAGGHDGRLPECSGLVPGAMARRSMRPAAGHLSYARYRRIILAAEILDLIEYGPCDRPPVCAPSYPRVPGAARSIVSYACFNHTVIGRCPSFDRRGVQRGPD